MLQEAVSVPIKPGCESKTLACLKETLKKVEFLSLPKKPGACSPVFYALQLVSRLSWWWDWIFTDMRVIDSA